MVKTIAAFSFTMFCLVCYTLIGIPAFVLSLFGLKKPMAWVLYRVAQTWGKGIVWVTGCKPEVVGRENIPKRGGVCFVSNHVGIFDIILALAYIGRPFGFVAKKELIVVPLLNIWIYILGGLFIDRKNIKKALATINHGVRKIQKGGSMLIFPEGTRSKGRGLLPFRSGALKLAIQSQAPIVPIAITGSYDVFEKSYRVCAVPVRVVFCPPIITADMTGDDRKHKLPDQVHGVIEEALNYNL